MRGFWQRIEEKVEIPPFLSMVWHTLFRENNTKVKPRILILSHIDPRAALQTTGSLHWRDGLQIKRRQKKKQEQFS
jgi:hypothetical protein